jgi:hypothetical protein
VEEKQEEEERGTDVLPCEREAVQASGAVRAVLVKTWETR